MLIFQTYADPPVAIPIQNQLKDDKAFDNTAFVDYEEPSLIKTDYCQLNDTLEPNELGNTLLLIIVLINLLLLLLLLRKPLYASLYEMTQSIPKIDGSITLTTNHIRVSSRYLFIRHGNI